MLLLRGGRRLGRTARFYPLVALGLAPQHTRHDGEESTLEIGRHCVIREHVTMHPGTAIDAMRTVVGDHGLFLVASHVAHDWLSAITPSLPTMPRLAANARIGNHVMMGGFATVQQWCRVGDHAMASQTAVDSDVIPFGIAVGNCPPDRHQRHRSWSPGIFRRQHFDPAQPVSRSVSRSRHLQ